MIDLTISTPARFFLLASLSVPLVACVVEDNHRYRHDGYDDTYPSVSASPAPPPTSSNTGAAAASPLLVEVDTNQTMTADPGQGVGVFVEYATGGHWYVWWTCDTAKTQQSCDFSVDLVAASGAIGNVDSSGLPAGTLTTSLNDLVAKTTTSNEVHGVKFDTDPGAILTASASIGGLKDGSFLFFVQEGAVNGGYPGKLTNPLQLQGKTP